MTITHAAFDLTVQGLLPLSPLALAPTPWTSDISPPALVPWTCGGHHWRPVQTCSFGNPLSTSGHIWWLKHVRFPSGRYASEWNVFLSIHKFKTHWKNHMAGFKLKGRGKSLDGFITRNCQKKHKEPSYGYLHVLHFTEEKTSSVVTSLWWKSH